MGLGVSTLTAGVAFGTVFADSAAFTGTIALTDVTAFTGSVAFIEIGLIVEETLGVVNLAFKAGLSCLSVLTFLSYDKVGAEFCYY